MIRNTAYWRASLEETQKERECELIKLSHISIRLKHLEGLEAFIRKALQEADEKETQ